MTDLSKVSNKELFDELYRRYKCSNSPYRQIMFLGPPGSGKGTQGPRLAKEYCLCHLSVGDLLRAEVKSGSKHGLKLQEIISKGTYMPDEDVLELLKMKMATPECRKGALIDGFSVTIDRARKLDALNQKEGIRIDKVFNFVIPDEKLIERIEGRRLHPESGRTYHIKYNPPKVEGVDDVTGEKLIQRNDDTREILVRRLENYRKHIAPVLTYYKGRNSLCSVDATKSIDEVYEEIKKQMPQGKEKLT